MFTHPDRRLTTLTGRCQQVRLPETDMGHGSAVLARELGLEPYGILLPCGSQQRTSAPGMRLSQVKVIFERLKEEDEHHLR